MDPATAAALAPLLQNVLGIITGTPSGPAQPSAAEVALLLERQRQAERQRQMTLLAGLGIAAVAGVGLYLLVRRK